MDEKISLDEIANQAMVAKGFIPNFSQEIEDELKEIHEPSTSKQLVRDMRDLFWISIDNVDSKDLDQLTYAEENKIYVAIADVDGLVKKGSFIDKRAAHNTTSIYTPTKVFPMLPSKLSNDLTSLNEKVERSAIVVEINVDDKGRFSLSDIYPALVYNKAKLNYPCVGAWLEKRTCPSPMPDIEGLLEQIILQDKHAQNIYHYRAKHGALEFGVVQLHAVIKDGVPISIEEHDRNRADQLIENFMIAANVASTRYLKDRNLPTIRRVVKTPRRWNRIVQLAKERGATLPSNPDPKALRHFLRKEQDLHPAEFPDLSLAIIKLLGRGEYVLGIPGKRSPGHFDLAEREYTHATAPNRRFPDLIMQRLLKSALFKTKSPYTKSELNHLAIHCTEKENDAQKLERHMIKSAAAFVMQDQVGNEFQAMVTGSAAKGTWVRLISPRIEGKLVKGFKGVDVGDLIRVRLDKVDVHEGHIDFVKV